MRHRDRAAVRRARCRRAGPRHRAGAEGPRKVVLATSIAETSLTIEGVRIVVDSGVARVPRYEPDIGLTRLETVRASRAAVDQRRGRAGRTEPGVCYRLWDEPQTASLAAYTQPEILSADLSSLVLDLAQWGVGDPATLAFLDPPPAPALKEARSLLRELGALDGDGRITAEGKSLRALALPPRLARMIVDSHRLGAGEEAAEIAAVLTERGLGGDSVDLDHRLDQFRRDRSQRAAQRAQPGAALGLAGGGGRRRPSSPSPLAGEGRGGGRNGGLASRGDHRRDARARLSRPRRAQSRQWQLRARQWARRGGRSGFRAGARALYRGRRTDGHGGEGRILLAAPIAQADIEVRFADQIENVDEITFDRGAMALRARRKRTLHAITLSEAPLALTPSAETARVLADGLIAAGLDRLPWSKPLKQWRDRVMFLRRPRATLPGLICPMTRSPRNARHGWCLRSTTRFR